MPDHAGLPVAAHRLDGLARPPWTTAKYWCGLAIRLTSPPSRLGERDVAAAGLEEPALLEQPVQQQVDRRGPHPVAAGCGTGLPSSSTFHGAKCSNGVNAVPYLRP